MKICAIAAMDRARVIGFKDVLPWSIKEDMQRFRALTANSPVLMGRKTFESLPGKFKPLPNRTNIVVSRNEELLSKLRINWPEVITSTDLDLLISNFKEVQGKNWSVLWIIGGAEIYGATLPYWDEVYLTLVEGNHIGDAYFPRFEEDFKIENQEVREGYTFLKYKRVQK